MTHLTRRLLRDLRIVMHELPGHQIGREDPRVTLASRSIGELYGVMVLVMLAWIIYMGVALPPRNLELHHDLTWVGFDCLLLVAMGATAWHAVKLNPRVTLAANATATLLIVDAWMDVTTSASTGALVVAIAFAVFLEVPIAALSLRIARHATRSLAARARLTGGAEQAPSTT